MNTVLLLLFPLLFASQKPTFQRLNILERVPSDQMRDPMLEKALERSSADAWSKAVRYLYNRVDLNGDGEPEILVQLRGKQSCATAPCPTFVLRKDSNDYAMVSDLGLTQPTIFVSRQRTNGWNDLMVGIRDPAQRPGDVHVQFDGEKYRNIEAPAKRLARPLDVTAYLVDWAQPGAGVRIDGQYIRGVVVSETGEPLVGVQVWGGNGGESDAAGAFTVDADWTIAHFILDGYRPLTRILEQKGQTFRIVLTKNGTEEWIPPKCNSDGRRFTLGAMSFQAPANANIKSGRDVDYETLSVQFGKTWMQLGSGSTWSLGHPGSRSFYETAATIQERAVRFPAERVPVTEYRGQRVDGTYFRWIGMVGTTVSYDGATKDAADYFDRIMDSLCWAVRN